MMNTALRGKPDAGNPHVRFDEGEVAPENPRRGSLLYKKTVVLGVALTAVSAWAAGSYDVRDYGAAGDGRTKDTHALQRAIDAAHAAGGGTVEVPAGTYLSGTIWLKSNIDFHLGAGAVIRASVDPADYNAPDAFIQNRTNSFECNSGAHLVLCVEQKNVMLRGPGKIDGSGPAIVLDKDGNRHKPNAVTYTGLAWRPGQMVEFVECDGIRLQDIALENSPYWTCYFHACNDITVRGVQIKNNPKIWNGDGIDLDECQYVTISDCRIQSADDAITFRAVDGKNYKRHQDMAFVTVNNCVLRTSECNAFRVGVGGRDIHDITVSNVTIEDSRTAVMIGNGYPNNQRNPQPVRGTGVWNMNFNSIWSHTREFCLLLAQYSGEATTRNISFSDCGGTVTRKSRIWSNARIPFENIKFRNVNFDKGVEAVNVKNLVLEGCALKEIEMTAAERAKLADDITNYRQLTW